MNPRVREKLCQMLAGQGPGLLEDARRCEGLLRDYCPNDKREVHVLMGALREKVPSELASPGMRYSAPAAIGRLTKRLEENLALAEEPARWAVESWALALGVVTPAQLAAAEKKRQAKSPSKSPPAQPPPVQAPPVVRKAAAPQVAPVQPVITRRPGLLSRAVVTVVLLLLLAGIGMTVLGDGEIVQQVRSRLGWDQAQTAPPAGSDLPAPDKIPLANPTTQPEIGVAKPKPEDNHLTPLTPEEQALVREEFERLEKLRKKPQE